MTEKYVTLPRQAVEQTLEALIDKCIAIYAIHGTSDYMIVDDGKARAELLDALRSALEQPQGEQAQIGSHRDAQEVPFEAWWEKHGQFLRTGGGQYEKTFAWHAWCEATKKPQPQGDQGAVGFVRQVDIEHLGNTPSDWASMFGQATGYNTVPVYTRPKPKREPLTDEEIDKLCPQFDDPMRREMWIIGFKAAHNIK